MKLKRLYKAFIIFKNIMILFLQAFVIASGASFGIASVYLPILYTNIILNDITQSCIKNKN